MYGSFFWTYGAGRPFMPEGPYYMSGAGGQYIHILPTHELVVVRLGQYEGERFLCRGLKKAFTLLIKAVPVQRK